MLSKSLEQFSAIVGRIYDASLDPILWTSVLAELSDYIGAFRATLILEDAVNPAKSITYASYSDAEWLRTYITDYMLLNPMRHATLNESSPGAVILTSDFMTPAEYGRSRFAREFLSQRNITDIAVAVLEKTATTITVLSMKRSRDEGFADEEVRQKLKLIAPHMMRAVTIGRIFENKAIAVEHFTDALNALSSAVLLLDTDGHIVHANTRGARMLDEAAIIRRSGGLLIPLHAPAKLALEDALRAAREGDLSSDSRGVTILFSDKTDQAFHGIVMPLTNGARRPTGLRYKAVAVLCLRESKFAVQPTSTRLMELYDLTQREMIVLLTLVDAGSILGTSEVLGLSQATVKTHLKSIYSKTGSSRQADLIKLVASMYIPFG